MRLPLTLSPLSRLTSGQVPRYSLSHSFSTPLRHPLLPQLHRRTMHTRLSTFPLEDLASNTRLKAPHDALLLVCPDPAAIRLPSDLGFRTMLNHAAKVDHSFTSSVSFTVHDSAPGGRMIVSPVGSTNEFTDDVRKYADAAAAAVRRARAAGSIKPLLYVPSLSAEQGQSEEVFAKFREVALLGALQESYVPLQRREIWKKLGMKDHGTLEELSLVAESPADQELVERVRCIELGRTLARGRWNFLWTP